MRIGFRLVLRKLSIGKESLMIGLKPTVRGRFSLIGILVKTTPCGSYGKLKMNR